MVTRWITAPQWLKMIAPRHLIWDIPCPIEPVVYLTFDDGPHPIATPFVLEQLKAAQAKATFFCIGHNVVKYPEVYQQTLQEGHVTGNHTYNHLNGWKTENEAWFRNIGDAAGVIRSRIFRPPYGVITPRQVKRLSKENPPWKIYMWDIISYDFDKTITPQACTENVISNLKPGSIVVFHDSEKAWDRMHIALPEVIKYCQAKGWKMQSLPQVAGF